MPHINEKLDFTVEVFVVNQNRVLLRKHDKYGIWLSVGGHIEPGEDPIEAGLREVREEVGLDVYIPNTAQAPLMVSQTYRELIPPLFVNRHRINPVHEHVSFVYAALSHSDKLTLSESEKSDACKWFWSHELYGPEWGVGDTVRLYAQTALEVVSRYHQRARR